MGGVDAPRGCLPVDSMSAAPSAADRIAHRFSALVPEAGPRYHAALAAHLAGLVDHPCLPMYFEYAATCVQRGRRAVARLSSRLPLDGARVLDIGCAYGGFLVALAEAGALPMGIDLNPRLLHLAEILLAERGIAARVQLLDATHEHSAFLEAFDLVVANDVLEHVADLDAFLANLARWLKPSGLACLEIPNGRAAEAVLSDGHYQLLGATLLDVRSAAAYVRAARGLEAFDVFNYPTLSALQQRLGAHGLTLEVLPESLAGISLATVDAALERLEQAHRLGLAEVPEPWRSAVAHELESYLGMANAARNRQRATFLLDFGAGFWQVLMRRAR